MTAMLMCSSLLALVGVVDRFRPAAPAVPGDLARQCAAGPGPTASCAPGSVNQHQRDRAIPPPRWALTLNSNEAGIDERHAGHGGCCCGPAQRRAGCGRIDGARRRTEADLHVVLDGDGRGGGGWCGPRWSRAGRRRPARRRGAGCCPGGPAADQGGIAAAAEVAAAAREASAAARGVRTPITIIPVDGSSISAAAWRMCCGAAEDVAARRLGCAWRLLLQAPLTRRERATGCDVQRGDQVLTGPGHPGPDRADRAPADLGGLGVAQVQHLGEHEASRRSASSPSTSARRAPPLDRRRVRAGALGRGAGSSTPGCGAGGGGADGVGRGVAGDGQQPGTGAGRPAKSGSARSARR